jgi:hypothetical protein
MATFTREYERVKCPGCRRTISAYIPHFADGSGLRVVKHNVLRKRGRGNAVCPVSERIIVREMGEWRIDA